MKSFRSLSTSEQLTAHLRQEILSGRLSGAMPGIRKLVRMLGVNSTAVTLALKKLEQDGLLESAGPRRSNRITVPDDTAPPSLRVGFLNYEPSSAYLPYILTLRHELQEAGHSVMLSSKSQYELKWDVRRIGRVVEATQADVWVVFAGSMEVLQWFEEKGIPVLALFGRHSTLPIASAGPQTHPALADGIRRLVELGHQRIVFLMREEHRKPSLGKASVFLLDQLKTHGIQTGAYNMPDWEDTPEGLQRQLETLFQLTPPSALFIVDVKLFLAVRMKLADLGLRVPEQVSLVCSDYAPSFEWARPTIAHVHWDHRPVVRRIVRWVNKVALGIDDRRKSFAKAEFVDGGTVGPAPGNRPRAAGRKR